jgi:phosphoribosyl-AMP cyclohydrolase
MNTDFEQISIEVLEESTQLHLQFEKRGGLLPVAVQESSTGQILMLASVSEAAFEETIRSGMATFFSTSRQQLWTKGETSGDFLRVDEILVDCDQDALVYRVTLLGEGVCHTFDHNGRHRKACFYRKLNPNKTELSFLASTK